MEIAHNADHLPVAPVKTEAPAQPGFGQPQPASRRFVEHHVVRIGSIAVFKPSAFKHFETKKFGVVRVGRQLRYRRFGIRRQSVELD